MDWIEIDVTTFQYFIIVFARLASMVMFAPIIGSGSIPDEGVASKAVRMTAAGLDAEAFAGCLRLRLPSVFGRIKDEAVLLDMRTVFPDEVELLAELVAQAAAAGKQA